MSDTSYSVELKGINLPDDARAKIETTLRSAVLGELAKLDLSKDLKVEPLPSTGGRMIGFGLPELMGFIIRRPPFLVERDAPQPTGQFGLSFAGAFGDGGGALIAGSSTEALEVLYLRPDVRAAVISNSRAFADMLSQNEKAARAFSELIGGLEPGTDRFAPLLIWGVVAGAAALGAAVGWASRT